MTRGPDPAEVATELRMVLQSDHRPVKSRTSDSREAKGDLLPIVRSEHRVFAIEQRHRSGDLI